MTRLCGSREQAVAMLDTLCQDGFVDENGMPLIEMLRNGAVATGSIKKVDCADPWNWNDTSKFLYPVDNPKP